MQEDQHTEFKEAWHDEYVRYVSAFCNTKGGTLFIGVDDRGNVIGVDTPKRLLEKLPNFIAQKTGVMPLITLEEKAGKECISIQVQPSSMPISVHGRYYTRSGSVYEGIHRREKLVYPYDALREAILNAIIHREYFTSSEIHIRVYDDKLVISNEARLQDIQVEDLSHSHPSRPYNKLIADVFYKAGLIERIGSRKTGYWKITK